MEDIILTNEEKEIILQLRKDDENRKRMKELYLKRLKTAYEFAQWMDEKGVGSTFSTFCNEFGYDHRDASEVYEIVSEIIKLAKG